MNSMKKNRIKGKFNTERGITLLVLTITIVILIILSTVTISAVFGDGGLIEQASTTKDKTTNLIESGDEDLNRLLQEHANVLEEEPGSENPDQNETVDPGPDPDPEPENEEYFGDGSDGDLHIASGETYTVDIVEDAQSAILNLKSLTIDEGGTLTTSGRCQGLFIKVSGDCTINGTINMDKKAPLEAVNDAELAANPCIVLCGNLVGGTGGTGGKKIESQSSGTTYYGGAGGPGYVFGGGSGGGGAGRSSNGSNGTRAPVGVQWPYTSTTTPMYGSGGRGGGTPGAAPGGGGSARTRNGNNGDAYGGGAIYLMVNGDLTIGSTGLLTANGGTGATAVVENHHSTGYSNTYYCGSGGRRWRSELYALYIMVQL